MTYKTIYKYIKELDINLNNIKILSSVINPYTRIISDLFHFKKVNINSTQEEPYNLIKSYIASEGSLYDNHNIPQYQFLIDDNNELIKNIDIIRTESLTKDMIALGYSDFDIKNQVNVNIHNIDLKLDYYSYLNNDSIKLINEFYNLDFQLFNYDKIIIE